MALQSGGGGSIALLILLALTIVPIAGMWKLFTKAGEPGWAVLIPVYNLWVLTRIIGRPKWWFVLMLVPVVQIIPFLLLPFDIARSFGKGFLYGIGIMFLGAIFIPLLGFGSTRYNKPAAA